MYMLENPHSFQLWRCFAGSDVEGTAVLLVAVDGVVELNGAVDDVCLGETAPLRGFVQRCNRAWGEVDGYPRESHTMTVSC